MKYLKQLWNLVFGRDQKFDNMTLCDYHCWGGHGECPHCEAESKAAPG